MSTLSNFLSDKLEGKATNRKAIIKLKLALLAKKVKASKNPEVKSAFAEHLEKVGIKGE